MIFQREIAASFAFEMLPFLGMETVASDVSSLGSD